MKEQKTTKQPQSKKNAAVSPSILERFVMFLTPSKFMFLTHTPGDWCKPGTIHEKDGGNWVVTEWKQELPTALYTGGTAACFEVRGKKILR